MYQPEPIKTGYKFLDEMIGGYYPGEVTTIGGCEDSGKSAFVITQLNYITVDQKIPTLLVLNNMSFDVFIALMASYYCCITVKDIHSVLYSPIYRSSVDQYLNKLREAPLYIIETHPQSPEKLDYDMIGIYQSSSPCVYGMIITKNVAYIYLCWISTNMPAIMAQMSYYA